MELAPASRGGRRRKGECILASESKPMSRLRNNEKEFFFSLSASRQRTDNDGFFVFTEQKLSKGRGIRKPILSRPRAFKSFERARLELLYSASLVSAASISSSRSLLGNSQGPCFGEENAAAAPKEQDDIVVVEHQSLHLSPRRFVSSELPCPCFCAGVEKRETYAPAPIELHPCSDGDERGAALNSSSSSPEEASNDRRRQRPRPLVATAPPAAAAPAGRSASTPSLSGTSASTSSFPSTR